MKTSDQREAIRQRLAELELDGGGRLTPAAVVDDAKDPASPLHDCFQWGDVKAAHAHRLDQARSLITSIRIGQKTDRTAGRAVF